jgi:hypothetical protein
MARRKSKASYKFRNPLVEEILTSFRDTDWFANCGRRKRGIKARWVHSWGDAWKVTQAMNWPLALVMVSDNLLISLSMQDARIVPKWERFKKAIRPVLEPLVKDKTKDPVAKHQLPVEFVRTVHCMIENALAEVEFADMGASFVFCELARHYEEGHYPCGWDGDYPSGKVVLF